MVVAAGIRPCELPECEQLTGSRQGGLLIPYRDINGLPMMDGGGPFHRLRLRNPQGDQKYHQRSGTRFHPYIPSNFRACAMNFPGLVVVEGEKKALALACVGYPAVGIAGFYGLSDGTGALSAEFLQCLQVKNFEWLTFMGDADVIYNPQFSDAVAKLSVALSGSPWGRLRCMLSPFPRTLLARESTMFARCSETSSLTGCRRCGRRWFRFPQR